MVFFYVSYTLDFVTAGKRFVTDIELIYFAKALNLSFDELLTQI
jgi:hypothetical protein